MKGIHTTLRGFIAWNVHDDVLEFDIPMKAPLHHKAFSCGNMCQPTIKIRHLPPDLTGMLHHAQPSGQLAKNSSAKRFGKRLFVDLVRPHIACRAEFPADEKDITVEARGLVHARPETQPLDRSPGLHGKNK